VRKRHPSLSFVSRAVGCEQPAAYKSAVADDSPELAKLLAVRHEMRSTVDDSAMFFRCLLDYMLTVKLEELTTCWLEKRGIRQCDIGVNHAEIELMAQYELWPDIFAKLTLERDPTFDLKTFEKTYNRLREIS
jgi:hypothetical protein